MSTLKKSFSEFLGAFVIVFIGCGSMIINNVSRKSIGQLGIASSIALTIAILVFLFYKRSGAHFNPAISFSFFITGKLSLKDMIFYIASQLTGGLLAGFFLLILFSKGIDNITANIDLNIASKIEVSSKFFILFLEFFFAFFLMLVYSFCMRDGTEMKKDSFFLISGVYFIALMFTGPLLRSGINPLNILVPALFSFQFTNIFFYLGGIFSGALFGATTGHLIFSK